MVVMVPVFMVIVMIIVIMIVVIVVIVVAFDLGDPGCGGCHPVEVEHARVQELVEVDLAVVAGDDLGLGLEGMDDALHAAELLGRDFGGLVEQDDVAELDLLDHQVLDVLFVYVLPLQGLAAIEFVLHPQGVHDRHDAVQRRDGRAGIGRAGQLFVGVDRLGDRGRLADAAGLDRDVVEAVHPGDLLELGHEVHLERTADAAVLQGHEAVVGLAHDAALLDQVGVDVDLAEVIDDHGELDAAAVGEDPVQERGLAASEIAGEQQDRQGFVLQSDIHGVMRSVQRTQI